MYINEKKGFLKAEIIILVIIIFTFNITVKASEEIPQRVLILYDSQQGYSLAKWIKNLSGKYKTIGYLMAEDDYEEEHINTYSKIIIISSENNIDNNTLIEDIKSYNNNILWIGNGIEKILSLEQQTMLNIEQKELMIKNISYGNDAWNTNINYGEKIYSIVNLDKVDKVNSFISDGKDKYPNLWMKDNLTNLVMIPYDLNTYYLLADYLNDFLGFTSFDSSQIFIKLEDVDIFRDIVQLKEIADYLFSENVPFIISLIPVYIDEDSGYINTLSQMSGFVETLKYMQDRGGSIVINGCTASRKNSSTEDDTSNTTDELSNYIYNNIGAVLEECIKNGIYPIGFEPDNFNVKGNNDNEINKIFSTFIGENTLEIGGGTKISYPYPLLNNDNIVKYIPQNLGNIDPSDKEWLAKIYDRIKTISLVRGYVGGISFNSYLDLNYLKETIQLLKENNINFYDLKYFNNYVRWRDIRINSSNGRVSASYDKKIDEYDNTANNIKEIQAEKRIFGIDLFVLAVLAGFILFFVVVFKYYERRGKRKG